MIKEFTLKNYLSFKNSTTISMEALTENVSEFKEHVIKINNDYILKIATLYELNGAGKSNLLHALEYLKHLVLYGLSKYDQKDNLSQKFAFCGDDNK